MPQPPCLPGRSEEEEYILCNIDNVLATCPYATTLGEGEQSLMSVESLLSALEACGERTVPRMPAAGACWGWAAPLPATMYALGARALVPPCVASAREPGGPSAIVELDVQAWGVGLLVRPPGVAPSAQRLGAGCRCGQLPDRGGGRAGGACAGRQQPGLGAGGAAGGAASRAIRGERARGRGVRPSTCSLWQGYWEGPGCLPTHPATPSLHPPSA
jgi:hypothetical protein